jgi:hypothetical protein
MRGSFDCALRAPLRMTAVVGWRERAEGGGSLARTITHSSLRDEWGTRSRSMVGGVAEAVVRWRER